MIFLTVFLNGYYLVNFVKHSNLFYEFLGNTPKSAKNEGKYVMKLLNLSQSWLFEGGLVAFMQGSSLI